VSNQGAVKDPVDAPIGSKFCEWMTGFRDELEGMLGAAERFERIHPGWMEVRLQLDTWHQAAEIIVSKWETLCDYKPKQLGENVPPEALAALNSGTHRYSLDNRDAERTLHAFVQLNHRQRKEPA
jgi:hypothetical protein